MAVSPSTNTLYTGCYTGRVNILLVFSLASWCVCVCVGVHVCARVCVHAALTGPPSWVMEGDDQELVAGKQHTNEIRTIQAVGDQVYTLGYDKALRSFPQASNEFR